MIWEKKICAVFTSMVTAWKAGGEGGGEKKRARGCPVHKSHGRRGTKYKMGESLLKKKEEGGSKSNIQHH